MQEINLNGKSLDIVKENVAKLKQLFPEIITEDDIDFDKLKAVLGEYIEKDDESYRFTWHGKRDAFRKSQIPSTGTLRPCIEESKDWDTTQNLYIEGDNLEVLKLLQKSYDNRIKMIYIDPPYNKDKDFIYPDKWSDPIKEYKRITGQLDDNGNIKNSETEDEGGRHTNWLNMMYPRLRLARNLLTEDGVIFISIDDDELENLKKVCNEVFGEENNLGMITWTKKTKPINSGNAKYQLQAKIEYILVYCKSKNAGDTYKFELETQGERKYTYKGKFGMCRLKDIEDSDYGTKKRDTMKFPILGVTPPEGKRWKIGLDEVKKLIALERIEIIDGKVKVLVYPEDESGEIYRPFWSYIGDIVGTAESGKKELNDLMGENLGFDTVKPTDLIIELLKHFDNDILILDFFSGTATTADAVMQYNSNGNRVKYIMVQIPELIEESHDSYLLGYRNICEIGKERIRRAGENIKAGLKEKYDAYQRKQKSILEGEEQPMNPDKLDIGFKVLKLDNSNLKKWSVDVGEGFYKESKDVQNAILSEKLGFEVDNFVEGRIELDVVYEIMLKYGLELTYPIETYDFDGTNIYSIGYGGLIVCLDTNINVELADKIVDLVKELKPSMVRVALRDLSFKSDSSKTNFKETLKNGVYAYFDSSEGKVDKQNQFKFITI